MKRFSLRNMVLALSVALTSSSLMANDVNSATTSVWQVSKGEDIVYIGGTIHLLPASEFPLPDVFTATYENADTVVFEAQLPDPTDLVAQQKMIAAVAYRNGQTLKDELSAETYAALDKYLSTFGATADQLAGLKPGMVATMLVAMEAQRNQLAGEGVDAYFTRLAKRDGKPSEYLESVEFQIQMLANMGEGEEDRFIAQTLETLPELNSTLQDTINAWRVGNTTQLNELVIETFKQESPASFDELFTHRNQNWVPLIEAMFGDDDLEFVLVGAGHLVGEDNVLTLLQEKGYRVVQL
ncbi:TraB/GumN family protein [Alteromonas sp. 009811495]|uniref:TraB/GumN family protein n=1 Tax=Alteromonas sp. 009811495 TaxID=3002962 RepID=UPI00237E875D|nr:TraB/GumN family protein [Alteromonas sp. 009811495]WDT85750.1 TraB/GumN family protein [Alteromonas sp. 009811495]